VLESESEFCGVRDNASQQADEQVRASSRGCKPTGGKARASECKGVLANACKC